MFLIEGRLDLLNVVTNPLVVISTRNFNVDYLDFASHSINGLQSWRVPRLTTYVSKIVREFDQSWKFNLEVYRKLLRHPELTAILPLKGPSGTVVALMSSAYTPLFRGLHLEGGAMILERVRDKNLFIMIVYLVQFTGAYFPR